MRLVLSVAAVWALVQSRPDDALIWALLAIAWALPARGWLARTWRDSLQRQERAHTETLYEGRRDD